ITAKLVCPPNLTKWYSVNVTGIPLSSATSNSTLISPSNLVNPNSVTRTSTTNNPHFNASIINITSPVSGQQVPSGSKVTIFGTSMDDFYRDCKVYAKKNDLPFQNTTAAGLTGSRDYSVWRFAYTDEHGLITPGNTNNITAKISCNESKTFSYTSASIDSNNNPKNTITSYANVVLMGINQPPLAAAHVNSQEAKEGDEIVLDGKDSSDPNGDPLTYFWKQTSGFLDGFDIINPTDSVAHFKVPEDLTKDTTFEFELDVRDNFGGISTESVSIDATSNTAPIADAGGNLQAIRGEQVTLDGSASHDPDPTGKIISYLWKSGEDNDGGAGLSLQNANQPVAVLSVPIVQDDTTFEFTLTVIDDEGASAEDTVEVEVEAPSPPPPTPSPDPDPLEEPEDLSDVPFPSIPNEEDEEIGEEQNADSDLSSAELQIPEAIVETCFDGINIDDDGQFEEECEP
ncbi:MAG TPA: PKD domain-containing protein, partial [Nitrososphaeraceae archaeon]|nr:PKD domain-containing protein [Nitrososphaeraceae archaeon]